MMKRPSLALARTLALGWLVGSALFFTVDRLDAQSLRDPTMPPVGSGAASAASIGKPAGIEPGVMTVIVRNGHPYLVVGTRLYAQGQKLGQARIEYIGETEVWLREGGVLRKVAQFPGIQRRTVTPLLKHSSPPVVAPTINRDVYPNDPKSLSHD